MRLAKGGRPSKTTRYAASSFSDKDADPVTLQDLGIDKDMSYKWRIFARIPETRFMEYIQKTKQAKRELTEIGLLRLAKQLKAEHLSAGFQTATIQGEPLSTMKIPSNIVAAWEYLKNSERGLNSPADVMLLALSNLDCWYFESDKEGSGVGSPG